MLEVEKIVKMMFAFTVGIASAVALARDVWGLGLPSVVGSAFDVYDKWLAAAGLRDGLFEGVRSYWKHTVVLLWLVFASYAVAVSRSRPLTRAVFAWSCVFVFALLGGVLAGMAPPFPNLIIWPLFSIAAFFATQVVFDLIFRKGAIREQDKIPNSSIPGKHSGDT